MSVRPQIDDPQGVKDPRAVTILRAMKSVLDSVTGRGQGEPPLKKLGVDANIYGVAAKVNEVIDRLQSGGAAAKLPIATETGTLNIAAGATLTVPSDATVSGTNTGDQALAYVQMFAHSMG